LGLIKVFGGFASLLLLNFATRVFGVGGLVGGLIVVALGLWAANARRRSEPAVIGAARFEPPPLERLRPQRAWRVPFGGERDPWREN
jgi:hypothetical protein